MAKRNILIHLHPDFEKIFIDIFKSWNQIQNEIEFVGVYPAKKFESHLILPGAISEDNVLEIADKIRREAKYNSKDGIIVFTEKRLYDEDYYQLFVGGTEKDESPPDVGIISLDYLRKSYRSEKKKSLDKPENIRHSNILKALISNILFSLAVDEGLNYHERTKGCVMDFCSKMDDIFIGIRKGIFFCKKCLKKIERTKKNFLLDLVESFKSISQIENSDRHITETVLLRGEMYEQNNKKFDYDVALSYSGEDRSYAEDLAKELKKGKVEVFYDKLEEAKLWGKELHIYLSYLYRFGAKFCVVFISRNYIKNKWTMFELKSALVREFEDEEEYILPIRLDDTDVKEIPQTKGFITLKEKSIKEVSELILDKLS